MLPRILIVDDDQHFIQVLCRSLSRQNYPCEIARNGTEALAIAQRFLPDWITLDLRLEQESGLGLIRSLKQICPDSRIVILTGYASIPTAVEAVKLGAHNYLHKPATLQELLAAFTDGTDQAQSEPCPPAEAEIMSMERLEWEHIARALNEHEGNVSATARALNMHRRTLQRKLQKYAPH